MDSEKKERYARWQNYRITQLSFSINLFLSFAIASLAYAINLKVNNVPDLALTELICSIYWWSASSVFGVVATISRLLDFRYTARKIRYNSTFNACISNWCGKITWGSFWLQIITYCIGAYKFIDGVALS